MTESSRMTFEQTIMSRCSTRNFSKEIPPDHVIEEILKACIYAPYGGGSGLPYKEIRKIFVLKQDTEAMIKARSILLEHIAKTSKNVSKIVGLFPFLKTRLGSFSERLQSISTKGIPSLNEAPYFVIVAEKKVFPPVQKQSIAHSLQNMWLTATNLGLGFQLVFMTSQMSKNQKFLQILNLTRGEFIIDGCMIGYPAVQGDKKEEPELENFVTWVS
jgi:nitroreductase